MNKNLTQIINDRGGLETKSCPCNNKVKIITTSDGQVLVCCEALRHFRLSGRKDGSWCRVILKGGCPFELNHQIIDEQ